MLPHPCLFPQILKLRKFLETDWIQCHDSYARQTIDITYGLDKQIKMYFLIVSI